MKTIDNVSVAAQSPSSSGAVTDVSVSAAVAPTADRKILDGESVRVSELRLESLVGELARLRAEGASVSAVRVMAAMAIAKNLGVSKRARELARRRAEEIEKERRELRARKVTIEAALRRLENTLVAAADRQLLEENMARQSPALV